MNWRNGCILILMMAMILVGCGQERATPHQVSYLPYLEKGMTSTPSSTIPPTDTLSAATPHPTSTRPANPYYPLVKVLIDVGYAQEIGIDIENNVAYVRTNFDKLLPIRNGIPDFEHQLSVPMGKGKIIIDEKRAKKYVLAQSYTETIAEGVSVFDDKDQLLKFISFEGKTISMVLEPTKGWLYVYGVPNPIDELESSEQDEKGILMIIDGVNVIETIKPWEIRPNKAIVDPSTGQLYFASQYDPESPRTDSGSSYGRIDVYDGVEKLKVFDPLFTNIRSFLFRPNNEMVYVYTARYSNDDPYDTTTFYNGNIVSQTITITDNTSSSIKAGVIHPQTGELYLINGSELWIMTNEPNPQYKTKIRLNGKDVGFQQIIADPFSGNVYLNNWYDGTLTIIHDEEIIGVMQLNRDLSDMALNPNNGDLYLSNGHTGHIWILGFDEQTVFPK